MGIAQKFEKYVGLEQLYTELNAGQKKYWVVFLGNVRKV